MTLFAYLFSAFLFLLATFRVIALIIQSRFRLRLLRQAWQLNIRSQIHTTIIFISLLSFVIIGIATILFFINRYHPENDHRSFLRKEDRFTDHFIITIPQVCKISGVYGHYQ